MIGYKQCITDVIKSNCSLFDVVCLCRRYNVYQLWNRTDWNCISLGCLTIYLYELDLLSCESRSLSFWACFICISILTLYLLGRACFSSHVFSLFSRFSLLPVLTHWIMFCIVTALSHDLHFSLDFQILFSLPLSLFPFYPSFYPPNPSILFPSSQRVFQGEREGQSTWWLPETQRKTAARGGPQGRRFFLCMFNWGCKSLCLQLRFNVNYCQVTIEIKANFI